MCLYLGWAGAAAGCDCDLKGPDYDEQCKVCMCDNGVRGAWTKRICFDADSSIAKKWPERLQNCGQCKPGYRLVEYASDSYNTWKLCTSNLKCRASAFNTTGNCRGAGFEEYDTSKHDLRCSTANCSAKECCLATCSTGLFNNDSQCQTIEGWVRFDSSKNETMCSSGACAPEDCCFPKCRYGYYNSDARCKGATGFDKYDWSKEHQACSARFCSAEDCCKRKPPQCSLGSFNNDSRCRSVSGWAAYDTTKDDHLCRTATCEAEECCVKMCSHGDYNSDTKY